MAVVLGIDLGTSFSCAAAVRDEAVVVVEDSEGRRTLPSIVHFDQAGGVTVGYAARAHVVDDPENTLHSVKRLLGRRFDDGPVRIAQSAYYYRISDGPNHWPVLEANGGPYSVPEVCACILRELRARAERFFGEPVKQAVIAVPANADDAQREQTRIAGRIAGLEVLRLLNEPTAAALAYALIGVHGRTMAVYDFGGGTFDCSIIQWGEGTSTVLATHGDGFLGGDDIDLALAEHVVGEFERQTGVDIRSRAAEWKRLLLECEEAKRALSRKTETVIRVPDAAQTPKGSIDLTFSLARAVLDRLALPFVKQTVDLMVEASALAGLEATQLDHVLLVGGSSRLPLVRKAVQEAAGRTPMIDIDPDTAVCVGAAVEAFRLAGGRSRAIERAPTKLVEVLPHSIGLATAGGGFDAIIMRNSTLPASGRRSYTTWRDGQNEMRFVVLQGDSDQADRNARLGEFVISGLPPKPAGDVEVELLFEVGADGLLRASARDKTTNQVRQYRVRIADSLRGS